ncbi:hypothetical protein HIM_04598 [Hirsutella minnesotensis 3608]|uniref:Uncharacterized protein n=1 Tax=Hirsutella minnesotensis 3608 TaxID=1043627 RepID=A0A0F8A1E9_9HYPO|nr:hypothetical protein HIM_04598 [Hirsutella minnesotensis 3608]
MKFNLAISLAAVSVFGSSLYITEDLAARGVDHADYKRQDQAKPPKPMGTGAKSPAKGTGSKANFDECGTMVKLLASKPLDAMFTSKFAAGPEHTRTPTVAAAAAEMTAAFQGVIRLRLSRLRLRRPSLTIATRA